ncbi:MAG TPA: N-acetyl-alpha-D-glucosaminyl L-malate synthase BshA, partial [Myxococcales bacterium]
ADGETGFLSEVGDVQSMARSVLRLLKDPVLHGRISRAARASALNRWNMESMIDRYESYCRRVHSRRERP